MSTKESVPFPLPRLPKQVLTVILTYLDVRSLGAVDESSKFLGSFTGSAWKLRAAAKEEVPAKDSRGVVRPRDSLPLSALQTSRSLGLPPKKRLRRFYDARGYCRRMKRIACKHFHFEGRPNSPNDSYTQCKCAGCNELPDLFTGAYDENVKEYEFFVRMQDIYPHDRGYVQWEGFLPAKVGQLEGMIELDMAEIHKKGELAWHFGLDQFLENPFPSRHATEQAADTFGVVAVTVAAMKRDDPTAVPQLVVATGGFFGGGPDATGNVRISQFPRNVSSHKSQWEAGDQLLNLDFVCTPIEGSQSHNFGGIQVSLFNRPANDAEDGKEDGADDQADVPPDEEDRGMGEAEIDDADPLPN